MEATADSGLDLSQLLSFFVCQDAGTRNGERPSVAPAPSKTDPFADSVLSASDLHDLGERIEIAASDPDFWAMSLTDKKAIKRASRADLQIDRQYISIALGDGPTEILLHGCHAIASFAHAVLHAPRVMAAPRDPGRRMDHLFYDPDLPIELRRGALSLAKALVATVAVGRAASLSTRLSPWLAHALAKQVDDGAIEFLTSVFRASQGLDRTDGHEENYKSWHREAIAQGADVYFPLGSPFDATDAG